MEISTIGEIEAQVIVLRTALQKMSSLASAT